METPIYLAQDTLLCQYDRSMRYASASVDTSRIETIDGTPYLKLPYTEANFKALEKCGYDTTRIRTCGGLLKRKLYDYQVTGLVHMLKRKGNTLLADEMGLGKTLQAVAYMSASHSEKTLFIVPANVKYQWKAEIEKSLSSVPHIYVCESQDYTAIDAKAVEYSPIVIINYDILNWWLDLLLEFQWNLMVFDEAHKIKKTSCTFTKLAYQLKRQVDSVICLSGTPLTDRTADIYNVVNIIDKDVLPTEMHFNQKYCRQIYTSSDFSIEVSPRTKELHNLLTSNGVMLRRRKSEVFKDMPKVTKTVVPLNVGNRKLKSLEADTLATVRTSLRADANLRNKMSFQIRASMEAYMQEAIKLKMPLIVQWVQDFLDENPDKKLVIGVVHKELAGEKLYAKFKDISVLVNGDVSSRQKEVLKNRFINEPKLRIFIGNIKSAGTGTDGLQHVSSDMVICELPWSPADVDQLISRLDRNGQKEAVNATFLTVLGSVDDYLTRTLDKKKNILSEVLDGKSVEHEDTLVAMLEEYLRTGGRDVA